jgi:hypothetical protein
MISCPLTRGQDRAAREFDWNSRLNCQTLEYINGIGDYIVLTATTYLEKSFPGLFINKIEFSVKDYTLDAEYPVKTRLKFTGGSITASLLVNVSLDSKEHTLIQNLGSIRINPSESFWWVENNDLPPIKKEIEEVYEIKGEFISPYVCRPKDSKESRTDFYEGCYRGGL